jgi:hypothetical protein
MGAQTLSRALLMAIVPERLAPLLFVVSAFSLIFKRAGKIKLWPGGCWLVGGQAMTESGLVFSNNLGPIRRSYIDLLGDNRNGQAKQWHPYT